MTSGNSENDGASPGQAGRRAAPAGAKAGPSALDRRKAALKANMGRRKEQARARAGGGAADAAADHKGAEAPDTGE